MASVMFNSAKLKIGQGNIVLSTDTFYVMLVTSSYTPDIDAHAFRSSVTNEISGTGYTTGGKVIANTTWTQDNTNNRAVFDGDDVSWASSTLTARGAVIYKYRGGASSADELVCYIDFSTDKSSTSGPFGLVWNSNGIFGF